MGLHEDLLRAARLRMIRSIGTTDRLIRQLYIRAAKAIETQIAAAKPGSLTERWLEAYRAQLREEIDRLGRGLYDAVYQAAGEAARDRAEAELVYLDAAAERAGAGLSQRFTDTLSAVPTDTLRAMFGAKMYTDGRTLSQRIWAEEGRLEGHIAEIIQQGIAQQTDPLTLARHLEAYVNPKAACPVSWHTLYPSIPFDRKIDYNALRLARTSIIHAHWIAGKAAAKKNPLCGGMKWNLSNQHYERQVAVAGEDICDEYARHDEGLGRGVFAVDSLPLPHPNCLCYQTEATPTLEDAADRLADWKGGGADPALDDAFEKWRAENAEELEQLHKKWNRELGDAGSRQMAGGNRRGKNYRLTEADKEEVRRAIAEIGADPKRFRFVDHWQTYYHDKSDVVFVGGNVMPDLTSTLASDRMSVRAVLAHEYYGHRAFRGTKAKPNSWNDEFRASYTAALTAPGLTDQDRADLINDAMAKAENANVQIQPNKKMRRLLYGYDAED